MQLPCTFIDAGQPDARGARHVRCTRCGRVLNATASPLDRIYAECRSLPHWHEFGHWLALFLGELGITKRRYVAVKAWLGLVPTCGCQRREAALNRWGERLRAVVGRLVRR